MTMVESNLMRYVPKKHRDKITMLYTMNKGVYGICVDVDGTEIEATVDGVKEIPWAVNHIVANKEFNF